MAAQTQRDLILIKVRARLVAPHPHTHTRLVPREEVSDGLIWGFNQAKVIGWMHESVC